MSALITDPDLKRRIIARRRQLGIDRWDEVWDGVYIMAPAADNQHFGISFDLGYVFAEVIKRPGLGQCFSGVNISDRKEDWTKNFRCPDICVFLNATKAEDCGEFWYGGPDFAIEVVSPRDRTRKKIPFYEKVGTRELLIIDRRPVWRLSLLRLSEGNLREVGRCTFADPQDISCQVVPLRFAFGGIEPKPQIVVHHRDGRSWTIETLPKPRRKS